MNPNLRYAQSLRGQSAGRGFGVIDGVHLLEAARSTQILEREQALSSAFTAPIKAWFRRYLDWLNQHPHAQQARYHPNNHSICWGLQAATLGALLDDQAQLQAVRTQFKNFFLPQLMNPQGGFHDELKRTKPYAYSLFTLDALAGVAQMASIPEDDLWTYSLADGRSLKKAVDFMLPFMRDKSLWPLPPDLQHWNAWPVRQLALLLAGLRYREPAYLTLWESLEPESRIFEVMRNRPLRHALIWIESKQI